MAMLKKEFKAILSEDELKTLKNAINIFDKMNEEDNHLEYFDQIDKNIFSNGGWEYFSRFLTWFVSDAIVEKGEPKTFF